jgi:hypothetical protein
MREFGHHLSLIHGTLAEYAKLMPVSWFSGSVLQSYHAAFELSVFKGESTKIIANAAGVYRYRKL